MFSVKSFTTYFKWAPHSRGEHHSLESVSFYIIGGRADWHLPFRVLYCYLDAWRIICIHQHLHLQFSCKFLT